MCDADRVVRRDPRFETLLARLLVPIASFLLAVVLTRFGPNAFVASKSARGLLLLMLVT